MLAGCATSGETPARRDLPVEPSFARPVIIAEPQAGEQCLAVAARERAGRIAANKKIESFVQWYRDLKQRNGQGTSR